MGSIPTRPTKFAQVSLQQNPKLKGSIPLFSADMKIANGGKHGTLAMNNA